MIPSEKPRRKARLLDLDPEYVDVIVRRWQDYAGAQATRQSDGVAFDALVSEPGGLENREAVGRVANES